ncbi:MAG: hypothetical protein WAT79_04550 [Saprospiraceae bacterium]
MKLIFFFIILSFFIQKANAQLDSTTFDFWVGDWNISYLDSKGDTLYGMNTIEKTLGGKVIQENFSSAVGFDGTSISVYNGKQNQWHQAWADNQGGFFHFIGDLEDDTPVFKTNPVVVGDKIVVSRMIFYDIQPNSFTWDWQSSSDGGKNWNLAWRIWYQRK